MLLANKLVVVDGIELGLTVSMCTAEGAQIGVLSPFSRAYGPAIGVLGSSDTPDLRAVWYGPNTQEVEALTPDGQAFLDLMIEGA